MNGLQVYHDIGPSDDVDVSFPRHSQPLFKRLFLSPLTPCLKKTRVGGVRSVERIRKWHRPRACHPTAWD